MSNHHKLREDAYRAWSRNGLDAEIKIALDRLYRSVDPMARTVLTTDGYQEFAATFLSRERTKLDAYRAGDPHDHPYGGVRKRKLCTCDDRYCPITEGRLPRSIRNSEDPKDATRAFKNAHPGDPLVLQDLQREYDDLCAEFDHVHRQIIICGTHDIHPDEMDDLAAPGDGDGGGEHDDAGDDEETTDASGGEAAVADD